MSKLIEHYCWHVMSRKTACGLEFMTPRTIVRSHVTCKNCRKTVEFQTVGKVIKKIELERGYKNVCTGKCTVE